jgi:hypothetical protein
LRIYHCGLPRKFGGFFIAVYPEILEDFSLRFTQKIWRIFSCGLPRIFGVFFIAVYPEILEDFSLTDSLPILIILGYEVFEDERFQFRLVMQLTQCVHQIRLFRVPFPLDVLDLLAT